MYPSLSRRFLQSMVYQAPHHTHPETTVLEALVSQHSWRRKLVQRNNTEFKDCCGGPSAESARATNASELLMKDYKFRNFREAFAWMTKVAEKAEQLKHHPEWSNVYNRVSVTLTTHSADSTLTSLDVELAQACDQAERDVISMRPPPKKKTPV